MSRPTEPHPRPAAHVVRTLGTAARGLIPFALADGTVIAVQDTGPRDADEVVVLVAGWTQDHTSWEDVVERLHRIRPAARVVAFDARGHGWSDAGPRGTWTIDQLGRRRRLPDRARTSRRAGSSIAGHSLGGPIVMAFAERHARPRARPGAPASALVATSAAGLGRDIFGLSGRITAPAIVPHPLRHPVAPAVPGADEPAQRRPHRGVHPAWASTGRARPPPATASAPRPRPRGRIRRRPPRSSTRC